MKTYSIASWIYVTVKPRLAVDKLSIMIDKNKTACDWKWTTFFGSKWHKLFAQTSPTVGETNFQIYHAACESDRSVKYDDRFFSLIVMWCSTDYCVLLVVEYSADMKKLLELKLMKEGKCEEIRAGKATLRLNKKQIASRIWTKALDWFDVHIQ